MRGSKAKRLRKLGLKSGPAQRPEPTEEHTKRVEMRQVANRVLAVAIRTHPAPETAGEERAVAKRERRAERNLVLR